MLVESEACCHVAKTFLSRLELIWLISRLQNSKIFPQKMHSWQKALRVNGLKYSVKSYYQLHWCQILQTSSGLKRSILHYSRMSRFSFHQVTFHFHLPNGQRLRQAISKLIKITNYESKQRLSWGKLESRFYLNLASWEMKIGLKNCAQFQKLGKLLLSGGLKNQVLKKFVI